MQYVPEGIVDTPTGLCLETTYVRRRAAALAVLMSKDPRGTLPASVIDQFVTDNFITTNDLVFLWRRGVLSLEEIYSAFERDQLWHVVAETKDITDRDLYTVFVRLLYRAETFPFTGIKLREWFDLYISDGKLQALIAMALYKTSPELISTGDVLGKLEVVVNCQPDSHGIHRLLLLALDMASDDVDKQFEVMDGFVSAAARLYFHEKFVYDLLVEIIKKHKSWYATVRLIGLEKLRARLLSVSLELQSAITEI